MCKHSTAKKAGRHRPRRGSDLLLACRSAQCTRHVRHPRRNAQSLTFHQMPPVQVVADDDRQHVVAVMPVHKESGKESLARCCPCEMVPWNGEAQIMADG